MSKAKFTYDESGATSFYFVLSFLALVLVPATYYLWPQETQEEDGRRQECRCNGCQNKRQHLGNFYKWKRSRLRIIKCIIIAGWLIFIFVLYRCSTQQNEYVNWDPFEILGVRENASPNEIKKAYRKLSLIYHPDKGSGNSDKFVKITKAYAALTDDDARKNWELYGNPDGPGATSFGIALPSWIVEKENSIVVLGIYALVFMVALPVSVGIWWYRSVKFGCDKVLITTTEVYYYFIHKTPSMDLKRALMIVAASLEFAKSHNPEVIERPTDNHEVPRLMRDLPNLGEKNKEKPLCFSYSVKARAIIHAHLSRIKLPPTTLEQDRCFIVRKSPALLQEFVRCVAQLITLALSGRMSNKPTLATLENGMKLSPMMVQAIWEYQNPLLQLPHFTQDTLRHLERKKVKIRSMKHLASMEEAERRDSLKMFNDIQYEDIRLVLSSMPSISAECKYEVIDDEDPGVITAGSIVTVTVTLKRQNLIEGSEDENKPKNVTEGETRELHPVHCPFFPEDKKEFWWVYVVDRKKFVLITAPILVTTLYDTEELELKFSAPRQPGSYNYTLVVRSDSYIDAIIEKNSKVDIMPAKDYDEPLYDIPDDEEEEELLDEDSAVEDPDYLTDNDDD